ncbi:fanconi-associated nuclease 1-like isoform X2 [Antedon mediterranea]
MDTRKKIINSSSDLCSKRLRLDSSNGDSTADGRKNTQPTIPTMFSSQKPIQKVSCPVCSTKLSISMINDHLDKQCLVIDVCKEDVENITGCDAKDTEHTSGNTFDKVEFRKTYNRKCNNRAYQDNQRTRNISQQSSKRSTKKSGDEIELQSNSITISYPNNDNPLFKIECQINSEFENSVMDQTSTSKYFDVKLSSQTETTRPSSSLKSTRFRCQTENPEKPEDKLYVSSSLTRRPTTRSRSTNSLEKDVTMLSQSTVGYASSLPSEASTSLSSSLTKANVNAHLKRETDDFALSQVKFSRISPAKSAKVKVFSNPLWSPPRSQTQNPTIDYTAKSEHKFKFRKVSKALFPSDIPSTSQQMNAYETCLQSNQQSSCNSTSHNSSKSPTYQKDSLSSQLSSTTNNKVFQRDFNFSNKMQNFTISPQKPATVKTFSRPLATPPKSQVLEDTKSNMEEKLDNSSQSSNVDLTPLSLYDEELSYLSQLESQDSCSQKSLFSTQESQSSNSSTFSMTADSTNEPSSLIKTNTTDNIKSPYRFKNNKRKRSSPRKSPYKHGVPYYLANFKLIMDTVLGNADDRSLFSDTELTVIEGFKNLSVPSQQLYVRLYQRKHAWLRANKVDYPQISSDLGPAIKELTDAALFINENDLQDPEEILKLLMSSELRDLAKSFKVNVSQKANLVQTLLTHGKKQKSVLGKGLMNKICQRAKKTLAQCIKLNPETKILFSRLMILFSITSSHEEEDRSNNKQTPMQTLLLADMGHMKFTKYKVERQRKVFQSRDELIRYETAHKYEADITAAMEKKNYDTSFSLFEKAEEEHKLIINSNYNPIKLDSKLPEFLRRHTALCVYTRITYLGVEILQKKGCYEDAVKLLRKLLVQTVYCRHHRGRWWDRLALNLSFHLKKPKQALYDIKQGLADKHVKPAYCYALQQRAEKICSSPSGNTLRSELESVVFTHYQDAPKVTIKGRILPHAQKGRNNVFVRSVTEADGEKVDVVCGVEEIALAHYRQCGYNEGVHAEGSAICTLLFLLFWDIVFAEGVPDVFRNIFQTAPLDLRTQDFYLSRQEAIDALLKEIKEADSSMLVGMLEQKWEAVYEELCAGVSWYTFQNLDHAKSLLVCFGGEFLSSVGERILKDHGHFRAGIPDLTVWNTSDNTFKLVEVKGPGDTLSHKQIIWLDFFLKHGADVEVCHVEAYTQKRQRIKARFEDEDT